MRYENQTLRLTDLLPMGSDTLEGVTFEGCELHGPAVIFLSGSTLKDSQLGGDMSSLVWELADERDTIVGAVALKNCTIDRCKLRRIGFAMKRSQVAQFAAGTS